MAEERMRNLKTGYTIDEETGLPVKSPRQKTPRGSGATGTTPRGTTPRGTTPRGNGTGTTPRGTTPRAFFGGSTTPRGFRGGTSTPRGEGAGDANDGGLSARTASILNNDNLPPEEFKDYLSHLDSGLQIPPQEGSNGKTWKSLDDALTDKFDINEVSNMQ